MTSTADSRRWWALAPLTLAVLTLGFDITILNVALPTIATDLAAGTDALQWIVNAYVLLFAGLMLPLGALGDRYGRKRLMLIGLALFAAASVLAAWAQAAGPVIAARALMGVGAAIITPIALAVLPVLFPNPAERGKAIAIVVAAMGAGIPLGPLTGGYLLEHFWWGSIFLVNVPVAALAMLATALLLPESRDPHPRPVDLPGAGLAVAGLVGFVYAVIQAPVRGWGDPLILTTMAAGLALLAGFVWWQRRTRHPLIDLYLFGRAAFVWGSLAAAVASFALLGLLFVAPQYLQFVLAQDPLGTGLRLLPMIGGVVVGAPAAQRLAARTGYRTPVTLGLLVAAAGLALGAATDPDSGYGFAALWFAIAGAGIGAALAPAVDAVLGTLPRERAGSGIAITMTFRYVGGALGVALLGSLLSEGYARRLDTSGLPAAAADPAQESIAAALAVAARVGRPALAEGARAAYVHAMSLVLIACAALAIVAALLTAIFLPRTSGDRQDRGDSPVPIRADQ